MAERYRSWNERRDIIRAIIADSGAAPPKTVASFELSKSEEVYFRARAMSAVDKLARKTSSFKSYYKLRTAQPLWYLAGMALPIVIGGGGASVYLLLRARTDNHFYPLLGAVASLTVAATGWGVGAWVAHRNAVRQNTNNLLFARYSQSIFTESTHRFNSEFGVSSDAKITPERLRELRDGSDEEKRSAEAVSYILNYFEFISNGVISGDLDAGIVRNIKRGTLCFYYDKCEPYIHFANRRNPRAFEALIKIRTHYREP
jgi:hypothetical protein